MTFLCILKINGDIKHLNNFVVIKLLKLLMVLALKYNYGYSINFGYIQ